MKEIRRILPVIIVVIIAVVSSVFIYKHSEEKYSRWKSAEGTIQKIEYTRKHKLRIYYVYTVEGITFTGKEVINRGALGEGHKAGSETKIWYDADAPSSSMYLKPNPQFDAMAPIFLTVPLCIIIVFTIYKRKDVL